MQTHPNAKLGPAGRLALTEAISSGMSPATAHRWWHRRRDACPEELASGSWLLDRSSRPCSSPRLLDRFAQRRICEARRKTGWGPRLIAGKLGQAHSTVWKVLHRHGLSRPARQAREPVKRYEWPCPGDLLHCDTARFARFERPGHAVTGDHSQRLRHWMAGGTRVGYDFAHAIVDDHSRLAYVELHRDERANTVTAFVERALSWFETRGIPARRLMTDNAWCYANNRSLRELLAAKQIKHLRTEAYRPQTNGKVERFHQTMAREWAYGMAYRTHRHRNRAMPHWLRYYNERRPHSSLGGRPPVSRVHNLCGQDT
jgi:transposase InsO family protein